LRCVQRADESRDTSRGIKLETSESFYHSLLRDRDNEEDNVPRYEGVDQSALYDEESTHMSWDEVRAITSTIIDSAVI